MSKQRLDKIIANQLIIPRSVVRRGIKSGKAKVNGEVVFDLAFAVEAESDDIVYDGQQIGFKKYIYILMNKPKGVLSASSDKFRETVVDLVPKEIRRPNLAPVGRLDKDTTGLLLITDDGEFAHNCISPKKKISKSYIVELDGDVTDSMIEKFKQGVTLADGTKCKSAVLERIGKNTARVVICEGKYHQIKRMFGTVGLGVRELHREAIGELTIPQGLNEGECMEFDKIYLANSIKKNTYEF